jgi:hypothetical protein
MCGATAARCPVADPVPWTFGTGGDYAEECAWLTDLMQAPTGGTQHRCLRLSPRVTVSFSALESGSSRRWFDLQLRANSAGTWQVPVGVDRRDLTAPAVASDTSLTLATANARFVVGGQALVVGEDPRRFDLVEISGIASGYLTLTDPLVYDWPAGTPVYPVRKGMLAEQPTVSRFTGDASGLIDLRFQLLEDLDTDAVVPGSTYRGFPVFDFIAPVWTTDPAWVPERLTSLMDDDIGVPLMTDLPGVALGKTTMQYAPATTTDVVAFRGALYALRGRWSPAWVPSWTQDLRIVADVSAGATSLDIEGPLLSTDAIATNHRDIRIALADGTVLYRRINAVAVASSTVDRLTLDSALPAFSADSVHIACFMGLCVQDSDVVTLNYLDPTALEAELTWRELDHEL